MLAGRGGAEGHWEGEFGQMEAPLVMETGACVQHEENSARVPCRRQRHVREEGGVDGLGGSQGDRNSVALQLRSARCLCIMVLASRVSYLVPGSFSFHIHKMWIITTSQGSDELLLVSGLEIP